MVSRKSVSTGAIGIEKVAMTFYESEDNDKDEDNEKEHSRGVSSGTRDAAATA